MSYSLLPKKRVRHVLDLQLTAMIDIFSLIVIFLIKGTVFGVSDLPVDPTIKLPQSRSKESLETAPHVQIIGEKVVYSGAGSAVLKDGVLISQLTSGGPIRDQLILDISKYLKGLSPEARGSGVLLSVIADKSAGYGKVFEVVRFFREQGFQCLLFVAAAPEGEK